MAVRGQQALLQALSRFRVSSLESLELNPKPETRDIDFATGRATDPLTQAGRFSPRNHTFDRELLGTCPEI
jgi:hypothetical protein